MALSAETRSRLGFLAPKSIEKEINNSRWRFYAVRVPMVAELLALSGPIAVSLSTLFSSDRSLMAVKTKTDDVVTKEGDKRTVTEQESPAASLEVMKHREAAKQDAIKTLASLVSGRESQNILARFVMDSLRDNFPAKPTQEDIDEFWNSLDLDVIVQMVAGSLEANAQVIRPFLGKVGLNLRAEAIAAGLRDRLAPVLKGSDPNLQPASLLESAMTQPTSGEPSSSS